jgi:uncharacterized repeat protein (TIGR01451 family)
MKNLFSYISKSIKRPLVMMAVLGAAVALPLSAVSAAAVQIEGSLGVANVTAGDTDYKLDGVNATFDQVVKFQTYYHNMENPDSGKNAENLTVKFNVPSTPGLVQTVSTTIKGDNTNTITDQVNVNLNRADAYIEYIPGSAVWKHNIGTNEAVNIVEEKISDAVVTSGVGLNLENAKPCFNFDATVTILARVRVPAVKIVKQSRVKGTTAWTTNNTANAGDTLEYLITYENIGNTTQNNVIVGDNLPANMTLENGTTYLSNATNPTPVLYNSDNIASGGINIGSYVPGGDAFVKFDAKIATADKLVCGANEFRNVGVVRPEGMNEYYNTAITTVNKNCTNHETPVYSCTDVKVEKLGGRKIKTTVSYNGAPANRVVFKNIEYNFGDGSTPLVSTSNPVEYTFAKDGTYKITAKVTFAVDGVNKTASGEVCSEVVTVTTTTTPPKELPYTGAGSNIALFLATTMVGMFIFRAIALKRS